MTSTSDGQLAEVWGDVVSRRHLGRAIIIGGAVSLAFYGIGLLVITPMAETPQIGRALAMLLGILGCLTGGLICARLYAPKRVLTEELGAGSAEWQHQVLDQIEAEGGTIGDMADLPPAVVKELHETGLYDVFANRKSAARVGGEV
ncbi:hypothetical protein [Falsirhodobacter halotolerans]|uniref:hypothetical protein n=1 Tax=Falsirhodobacter halotolerans TaxID=1146892 RepID=UPI001FD1E7C0|nr:hypothetical protein [Falsirhodobacter halotolerans]MCJ8140031.1 hypothetical protein [Falsirhodobacter halotolerans]